MKKMKTWITGIMVCGLCLSGCGAADEKKLSEDTSATQQTSAVSTETPGADSQEKEKMLFQTYMEKYPERLTDAQDWKTADGKYHNPIKEDDLTMDQMNNSWEERYAACQIPEEIIDEADTDTLLELVLDSPMLNDMYSYCDTFYIATKKYIKCNNGMYELHQREGFYQTVAEYYDNLDVPLKKQNSVDKILPEKPSSKDMNALLKDHEQMEKISEDMKVANKIHFCITVLAGMTEGVPDDELERAGKIISKKYSRIKKTEYQKYLILTEERLQKDETAWVDQTVMKTIVQSGK